MNEETRSEVLVTHDKKQLWNIQMSIAKKIIDVCKENNLKIWASDGTLLGTIRHNGFIPWDDDIDFTMFRDDYDKLVSISQREFLHPFFFQTAYSEKVPFSRGHAQVRMDDTTMILTNDIRADFHQGVFVDIFVMDGVPDDEEKLKEHQEAIKKKWQLLWARITGVRIGLRLPSSWKRWICFKLHCLISSYKDDYAGFENELRKEPVCTDGYVALLSFYIHVPAIKKYKTCWFDDILWMPFEDMLMPVPSCYDSILSVEYGNYMVPQQVSSDHGGVLILDLEKSYKFYLKDLCSK